MQLCNLVLLTNWQDVRTLNLKGLTKPEIKVIPIVVPGMQVTTDSLHMCDVVLRSVPLLTDNIYLY